MVLFWSFELRASVSLQVKAAGSLPITLLKLVWTYSRAQGLLAIVTEANHALDWKSPKHKRRKLSKESTGDDVDAGEGDGDGHGNPSDDDDDAPVDHGDGDHNADLIEGVGAELGGLEAEEVQWLKMMRVMVMGSDRFP